LILIHIFALTASFPCLSCSPFDSSLDNKEEKKRKEKKNQKMSYQNETVWLPILP